LAADAKTGKGTPATVAELMREADRARASGDTKRAIEVLQQVIARYPTDPQAGVASFVLGRLLEAEGQDREAMSAFEGARGPGARGALSEEALARQVELAAKKGDTARAAELSAQFERRYPNSSRRAEIRRFGQSQ
jgi:TolA-binding protein